MSSNLPQQNIIQLIKNRFLNDNLRVVEDEYDDKHDDLLDKLADEYGIARKVIRKIADRNNWWAMRNLNAERFLAAYDEEKNKLILDQAIDLARKEMEMINRQLHFVETQYESIIEVLELRKSTMSDKDLLTYLGMVMQAQTNFIKMVERKNKLSAGLEGNEDREAVSKIEHDALTVGVIATMTRIIGNKNMKVLPAEIIDTMNRAEEERSAFLSALDAEFKEVSGD